MRPFAVGTIYEFLAKGHLAKAINCKRNGFNTAYYNPKPSAGNRFCSIRLTVDQYL
jgi:hypothetical protein